MTVVEAGHLGGYIEGGDEATLFPDLWDWLVDDYGVKSVLDVGCGEGIAVQHFADKGARAVGIDGVPQENELVFEWDLTKQAWVLPYDLDLIWCCEFVEHLEERYDYYLATTLRTAKLVLMTHAFPGQAGYHHVNCRDAEYWKGFMAAAGMQYDHQFTELTKSLAGLNKHEFNHFTRSGMAFRRVL